MSEYSTISAHAVGLSHIKSDMGCEDYSAAYTGDDCSVITVSDGHGDKNCFRSAAGAMFACQISTQALKEFAAANSNPSESDIAALKERIISDWRNAVLADVRLSPFTSEEAGSNVYSTYTRPERAYGCTLVAALVTRNYFLALQIGDGAVVASYGDGIYAGPMPPDDDCVGNVSSSLCAADAQKSFRHFISRVLPAAVMAVSDGVEESFDEYGLFKCMYTLSYSMFDTGAEAAQDALAELLPTISQNGSRDDVSLALCADLSAEPASPKTTPEKIAEQLMSVTNYADGRQTELNALNRSKDEDEAQRDALRQEIETAQKELADKRLKFENLEARLASLRAAAEEVEFKLNNARQHEENVRTLLNMTRDFWEKRLREVGIENRK